MTIQTKLTSIIDVLDPANLLIVFANVLAFVILETLFFWFVASKSVEDVLQDKADLVTYFVTRRPVTEYDMKVYLETEANKKKLPTIANEQRQEREVNNWELVKAYIFPIGLICVTIIAALLLFMLFRRQVLTTIDRTLLAMVLGAFLTEVYFYFTVTSQLIYIGDDEITYRMYKSSVAAVKGESPP